MFVWYVIQLARSLRDTWYSWPDPCVIHVSRSYTALYTASYSPILKGGKAHIYRIQVHAQKSDLSSWGQPARSKFVTGSQNWRVPVEIFTFCGTFWSILRDFTHSNFWGKVGVIQWPYHGYTACITYHCDTLYSWQILALYSCITYHVLVISV